jgi:hypothetical protein
MLKPLALALSLLPVVAHADGVIIGHPVSLRFAAGDGLTYTSGSIAVTTEVVEFCNATTVEIDVDQVLEIGDPVLLPVGTICGIDLHLDDPTLLEGTGAGGSFEMALTMAVIQIEVDPPLVVTESGGVGVSDAVAVELGDPDWVTASMLQLGTGIHRVITSSHALHDTLKASVRNDSTVVVE